MAKNKLDLTVLGRITNLQGEPLEGLAVRAFDQDPATPDNPLGEPALTNADGRYAIPFTEAHFKIGGVESGGPDVFIRVYRGEALLGESPVTRNAGRRIKIDLRVDHPSAVVDEPPRQVSGVVRDADGGPLEGVTVAAFDRDLRAEQELGRSSTDREGRYRIEYFPRQIRRREKGDADLVVQAFAAGGAPLAASPVRFNAPPQAEIDLDVPASALRPAALFERVDRALRPLLDGVAVASLEEDARHQDLVFLAGETGIEKQTLARFALAHRLARLGLRPEFWFALLGGSFYAYTEGLSLADQEGTVLDALPSLDAAAVRKALIGALTRNDIPERLRTHADEWVEAFLGLAARQSVRGAGEASFARAALEEAGIADARKQERFARLFNEHRAFTPELLERLEGDDTFTPPQIADLRASYHLAELTQGDFSVVKVLKAEFGIREPGQVRALARHGEREWVELIERAHAAGDIRLPAELAAAEGLGRPPQAEVYAKTLERRFREAFPTAAFAGGLERAARDGGARGLRHTEALGRLLERHPEFELLSTPVDDFLGNGVHAELRSVAADPAFRSELKAVQRTFKLLPTFEAADELLADGIHSAAQVYRLGESEFVRRYAGRPGFTAEGAALAWSRAADTHAAAVTIVADMAALAPQGLPLALLNPGPAAAGFPNWNNLFLSGDACGCEPCRSVLGPAAYFADLLMFLRDRRAVGPAGSVKDVLFRRRPDDLGYLELSCENANTPLPYIDLVCEVLERVVAAGRSDVELVGFTSMPAPAAAGSAVRAALSAAGISAGADFSLSQVDPSDPHRWVVHGDEATWLLKKKGTPSFFAQLLPNTKASAAELRAAPAYVDAEAYQELRSARFPFGLPFDLFGEEVRAAFRKCDVPRWELMRALRGPAAPNHATDGEVAAEYFGISSDSAAAADEMRIILVADATAAGQQAAWGESGNAGWLGTVSGVRTFLRKTGLEYEELLGLIDLPFINPAGDIVVQHLDSSCDTAQKIIQGLNATKLDRIHRFLRLWRKLDGWKMWELDLVLRSPGVGAGVLDEPFLVQLYHFARLRSRLGTKAGVAQLCTLFGDLGTRTHFTRLYARREDGLYQSLFLNRRLTHPLDPAFAVAAVDVTGPTAETIPGHRPGVLAALGVREADLDLLAGLTRASNGLPYITGDLTLANLSFLWRHAWLPRLLKLKPSEWKTVLMLLQQDVPHFADAAAALAFVEQVDLLTSTRFTPDELSWLLAANRGAKAAAKETDAARFLAALRTELGAVRHEHDPARYPILSPPADEDALTALLVSLLQRLHRDEDGSRFFVDTLRDDVSMERAVAGLPPGFDFPPAIKAAVRIRYDEPAATLRFTGRMTDAEHATLVGDTSLAAVTGIAAYQEAVEDFFTRPRLALKFLDPVFTAPLASLPPAVDFTTLPDPALALRVGYDPEQRLLRVVGILSPAERSALDALSADPAYLNAVNSVATQPALPAAPEQLWLQDADLQLPLRNPADPVTDNLKANLATAVQKALTHLSRTLSEDLVVRRASTQLGLTEALTRRLVGEYALLPDPLLAHLTGAFAATTGVVDYATRTATFDGWFWALRVAALWKKWKLTLREWERVRALTTPALLLDFGAIPLNTAAAPAPVERFLRTSRLLRLRDAFPESGITLLEVLEKLNGGAYAVADFADDVQRLDGEWRDADVEALVAAVDLSYPGDYLLAESWERLRRGFSLAGRLNAGIGAAKDFAAATMTPAHAKALRELLRARFGSEAWLTLSGEIQDVLRGRKRDALAGWLLTQPRPADAPTGKWENMNDLYAYYLLDVEMGACQLTSRLVAGSGSVQLLVQRCFMGLEPDVVVQADGAGGDSAWRWWTWMRKYRVWEANRKVFLWPENWIEPELRKDRSPFFRELENELLQNEIDSHTVETAFTNYLERLDGVARLEIAGFYQEDDGDETVLHLFGRTRGAEPHVYYYRRYDYRAWTPWEKVDLEIQGDYLVPAVVNRRLFLFWPVFTEVPDEEGNSTVSTPSASQSAAPLPRTSKKLKLQVAASEYRQEWTPRRISTQYDLSDAYDAEIVDKQYVFLAVDRTATDGRFGIKYHGYALDRKGRGVARLYGAWEIAGCTGVPELASFPLEYRYAVRPEWDSTGYAPTRMRWEELRDRADRPQNDLSLENQFANAEGLHLTPVLMQTPGNFRLSPPWHLSYPDTLMDDGLLAPWAGPRHETGAPLGSWLPFFYSDGKRTFFVRPTHPGKGGMGREPGVRDYYPEVKREFRRWNDDGEAVYRKWADAFDLAGMTAVQRAQFDTFLAGQFPGEGVPPFADGEARALLVRFYMRFVHLQLGREALGRFQAREFHFQNFYHPFVCDFRRQVYDPLRGVPHLMKRETQLRDSGFSFLRTYQPTRWVVAPGTEAHHPSEVVDFSPDGAFSSYNWELFFHVPLLIGNALSRNQRFEEARDWYHFIFNPLGVESAAPGGSATSKYWIFAPFFSTTDPQYTQQRIENLLGMLPGASGASAAARKALEDQVRDWCTHPFEPHRIAAYRTVAYQKTVVMKYVDNLIAWGDHLFRQDSMESINEATQLYVLAAEILGPRPRTIPPRARPPLESFNELEKELDGFSNALVQVENLVPPASGTGQYGTSTPPLPMLYFCIPRNEKMLGYWDTVADRLYKIRHCMNIEGVARQVALFEPPIDPAALVKAVAGGVDIGAALADLNAPLPFSRFNVVLQKANEVCGDVKALGAALLSVLEKKDAEALALLRQDQEIRVLEGVRSVREKQVDEAKENLEGLKRSRGIAELRRNYYRDIEKLIPEEQLHLGKLAESHKLQEAAQGVKLAASIISLLPAIDLGVSGFGGSPLAKFKLGGLELGQAAGMAADVLSFLASMASNESIRASSLAGFARRWDDWKFQERMAERELDQFDRQIAAAELRVSIAAKELENHLAQTENAREVDAFLRSKYTSEELYQWQVGQLSGVYFQSYRLAHDLARRAERCFRFELGLQDSGFIGAGYWDSLRRGLLAGEKLQYDLRRLEVAHLEQDRRELEVTRHVSLALLDPLALVKLRETGRCFFRVPEEVFDLDYPGHYFRRIKSVSLTLPCVVGPYTTVSCTLRLLKNSLRISTSIDGGYARSTDDGGLPADDARFVENNVAVKAIAASSGQNDSGVFELSFRDERYLPFEGAGAVSEWTLELFSDLPSNNPVPATPDFGRPLRQFDYDSITDAILHVKYTAREDAGAFKNAAVTHLREYLSAGDAAPGLLMLNLRRDFPAEWSRFLRPTNPADPNVFTLDLSSALFPLRDAGQKLKLDTIWLLARCVDAGAYEVTLTPPAAVASLPGGNTMLLATQAEYGGLHVDQKDLAASAVEVVPGDPPAGWGITVERPGGGKLAEDPATRLMEVEDMILVLEYHQD